MASRSADDETGAASAERGPAATKLCRACCSPMPSAASKCIACGSLQNWQRFLGLSASVLGLLVALVSVLTFAVPIWKHQFYTPRPRPLIAYVEPQVGSLALTVSNGGDGPMTVSSFGISAMPGYFLLHPRELPRHGIVRPNEIVPVDVDYDPATPFLPENFVGAFAAGTPKCYFTAMALSATGDPMPVRSRDLDRDACKSAVLHLVLDAAKRADAAGQKDVAAALTEQARRLFATK